MRKGVPRPVSPALGIIAPVASVHSRRRPVPFGGASGWRSETQLGASDLHWLWEAEARNPVRFNLIAGALIAFWWVLLNLLFGSSGSRFLGAIPWVTLYPALRVIQWRDGGRQRRAYERHSAAWRSPPP